MAGFENNCLIFGFCYYIIIKLKCFMLIFQGMYNEQNVATYRIIPFRANACFEFYYTLCQKHWLRIFNVFVVVLYCTLLASSQSESERQKIRDKMNEDSSLARILRQLDTGKGEDDGGGEDGGIARASRRKEQADEGTDGAGGQVPGSRQLLDLEDLTFAQGSHFMANKRCQLPDGSFRKQRKGESSVLIMILRYYLIYSL